MNIVTSTDPGAGNLPQRPGSLRYHDRSHPLSVLQRTYPLVQGRPSPIVRRAVCGAASGENLIYPCCRQPDLHHESLRRSMEDSIGKKTEELSEASMRFSGSPVAKAARLTFQAPC